MTMRLSVCVRTHIVCEAMHSNYMLPEYNWKDRCAGAKNGGNRNNGNDTAEW